VRLRFRVTRPDVNAAAGGNFDLRGTYQGLENSIFKYDIPGLYARYISGLTIRNFDMRWPAAMPAYYSSGIQMEDFAALNIDGYTGRQASIGSDAPVISLGRGSDVSVRNSTALSGSSTFVAASEITGHRVLMDNDASQAKSAFDVPKGFLLSGNVLPEQKQ
jgi:hypothetical protein